MVKECTSLLELASWERPDLDGLVAEKVGGKDKKTSAASQESGQRKLSLRVAKRVWVRRVQATGLRAAGGPGI